MIQAEAPSPVREKKSADAEAGVIICPMDSREAAKAQSECALPPRLCDFVSSFDTDPCRSGSLDAECQEGLPGQSGTKGVDLTATVGGKWRELVRFGQGISAFYSKR